MVEIKERENLYTTDPYAGPSAMLVVLFSLLIVAVLGFVAYYFSSADLRSNPMTIIERDTTTPMPIPMPTSAPAPAPDVNVTPNINIPAPMPAPAPAPSTPAPADQGAPSSSGQ